MVEWLAEHGVTEVVLACGFLPDQLREALGDSEAGVRLSYVTEPERRGTAGAIRFAADTLGDRLEQRFLALNGDVLTDLDLTALLRAHEERAARATLALYPVEDASAYGLVHRDEDGAVLEFLEKTGEHVPRRDQRRRLRARPLGPRPGSGRARGLDRARGVSAAGRRRALRARRSTATGWTSAPPSATCRRAGTSSRGGSTPPSRPTAPGMLVGAGAEIAAGGRRRPSRRDLSRLHGSPPGREVRDRFCSTDAASARGRGSSGSILAPGVSVAAGATLTDAVAGEDERVPAENP